MIRVVLDGLVKRLDRLKVIDGLSLEIHPGELTYLLGPSGAGKTTLGRLIAGLEGLDSGEIYLDGQSIRDKAPGQRSVGYVAAPCALWPHLSVREHVEYGLRIQKVGARQRREKVEQTLESLRLDGLSDRKPAELTLVQRRRTAVARALALDPQLLILDEPLRAIEGLPREDFRDDLRQIHLQSDLTLLIMTDSPSDALAHADRLVILDLGRIVQEGLPEEVYQHPADTFVAQLLGAVNQIPGQLEGSTPQGEVIVRTVLGRLIGRSAAAGLSEGPVTVLIRPESLNLTSVVPAGSNRFPATLERQVFLGSMREIHLRGPGDWPVVALALPRDIDQMRDGRSVTVSVPPAGVIVCEVRRAGS